MLRSALRSLRARLVGLVLLAVFPALVLVFYSGLERRQLAIADARQQAHHIAHLASTDYRRIVSTAQHILAALAHSPLLQNAAAGQCPVWLGELPEEYASLRVERSEGDVFCSVSSASPLTGSLHSGLAETFDPMVDGDRSQSAREAPITMVTQPIIDGAGEIRAVASITVNMSWLDGWAGDANLPAGSTVIVLDHTGTILARRPDNGAWVGKSAPQMLFSDAMQMPSGDRLADAPGLDGVQRLFALTTLRSASSSTSGEALYLAVGIPRAAALHEANWQLVRDMSLLGLVLVLAVEAAWFVGGRSVARPAEILVRTVERLASGDLSARTGLGDRLGEMSQLASAFDRMAVSLRERSTERDQAVQSLQGQLSRTRLLNEITRAIAEHQDLHSILRIVVTQLEKELAVDWGCAAIYDPDRNAFIVTACGAGAPATAGSLSLEVGTAFPADQAWLAKARDGQVVHVLETAEADAPYLQRLADLGIHSGIVVPLMVEEQLLGALFASCRQAGGFGPSEVEFLVMLGKQVALAAHQARLYEELRAAYDELRQTQQVVVDQERLRALGEMASGIAHDINNALSPAVIFTELLRREPSLDVHAKQMLDDIYESCSDVVQMLARLRQFYREPDVEDMAPVNLNEVVEHIVTLTRPRWRDMPQSEGIVITAQTDLTPGLPLATGVESEIREALTNLVFNAVDAMPNGGELRIRTRANGWTGIGSPSYVAVEVRDTGIGMDEETRRRCLEPFYTTKGAEGTGLGLPVVHGIMQRHKGRLEIESAPGQGTTVRLLFPVHAAVETDEAVVEEDVALDSLRVLYVDDEPMVRRAMAEMLKDDGHVIEVADSGMAGIEAFRSARARGEPFDVVITDLGMPYVSGRDVARVVKQDAPTTGVVLLTGWGTTLGGREIPPNVDWILSKPPRVEELRHAIASVSGNHLHARK